MAADSYENSVVAAVQEMTQRLIDYERHADEERAKLREYVIDLLQSFRKDVHLTTAAMQIKDLEHERTHDADRVERIHRQWTLNIWLAALILLGAINIALSIYLVGSIVRGMSIAGM